MSRRRAACAVVPLILISGCGGTTHPSRGSAGDAVERVAYTVVARHPHDTAAFTEGLVVHDGAFLEGTGLVGRSELRRVEIASGRVRARRRLPPAVFGEGVTVHGDHVFQLTWKNHTGFLWRTAGLRASGTWRYAGEGWGLTTMGDDLVMSDGTSILRVLDPATRAVRRRVTVTEDGAPVERLNELEYVGDGRVAANVWPTTTIVVVDMATGHVTATLDISALAAEQPPTANEANGIALDPRSGHWYVTGKNWATMYEIAPEPG